MIVARHMAVSRGERRVLEGLDFSIAAGEFIALAGLNGAGKSTLIEALAGAPYRGECLLRGSELRHWTRQHLSHAVSFLPQTSNSQAGFAVRQVVAMGRFPHSGGWVESPEDIRAIDSAMDRCQCTHLAERAFDHLSGGEKQRVLLAAVLAQETPILLLDEPSAHVDLPQQIQMYTLLRNLTDAGSLCIAATHDLNLAAAFATRLILLHDGGIAYDGDPEQFFYSEAFCQVFGPGVTVARDAQGHLFAACRRATP